MAWSFAHGSDHSKMIRWETQALNLKFEQIAEWPGVEYQPMPNAENYLCASLEKVLTTNGVLMGHHLHGDRLTEMVIVYAKDGYKVSFSLAELDAGFKVQVPLLCHHKQGQPLNQGEGPFRLFVPSDQKRGRWVRQVESIEWIKPVF